MDNAVTDASNIHTYGQIVRMRDVVSNYSQEGTTDCALRRKLSHRHDRTAQEHRNLFDRNATKSAIIFASTNMFCDGRWTKSMIRTIASKSVMWRHLRIQIINVRFPFYCDEYNWLGVAE